MIIEPEEVTAEWLTDVLRQSGSLPSGHVTGVRVTIESSNTAKIGRLILTYSDGVPSTIPARLFLKISNPHSITPVVGSEQRRCEVEFHNTIATLMPDPPVIRCHHAFYNEETGGSNLIFNDVSETHFAVGSTQPPPVPQAEKAVDAFSEFHAFWWDHETLDNVCSPQNQASVTEAVNNIHETFPRFTDFLGDLLTAVQRQAYENTLTVLPNLMERRTRGKNLTLIHGDSDGSNVLLPIDPDRHKALIIDWQLWNISFAAEDLAHLIALFWDKEYRQRMEEPLLRRYHQGLIRHGVKNYAWTDCWDDYRLAVILRVLFMPMWFWNNGAPPSLWERSLKRAMEVFEDLECQELLDY
jgi:hypothetical protein